MSIVYKLKRNLMVRGVFSLFNRYFVRKSQFGMFGTDARITPPCAVSGAHNISLGDGCVIGANSLLMRESSLNDMWSLLRDCI